MSNYSDARSMASFSDDDLTRVFKAKRAALIGLLLEAPGFTFTKPYAEIGDETGMSINRVSYHLLRLAVDGIIILSDTPNPFDRTKVITLDVDALAAKLGA